MTTRILTRAELQKILTDLLRKNPTRETLNAIAKVRQQIKEAKR